MITLKDIQNGWRYIPIHSEMDEICFLIATVSCANTIRWSVLNSNGGRRLRVDNENTWKSITIHEKIVETLSFLIASHVLPTRRAVVTVQFRKARLHWKHYKTNIDTETKTWKGLFGDNENAHCQHRTGNQRTLKHRKITLAQDNFPITTHPCHHHS